MARLDSLIKEIHKFEKKAGFENTSKELLLKWIEKEVKIYRKSKSKEEKANKIMDIIILCLLGEIKFH
jgi:hypothetical protein